MTGKKHSVLIVDDAPENIDSLRGLLSEHYQLKIALNGRRAIELAKTEPKPNLILLDIVMPEMDGFEVCAAIKEDPELQSIPIIFLTSLTEAKDEMLGFSLGANDYISKPFDPAVVKSRINIALELAAQRNALQAQMDLLKGQLQSNQPQSLDEAELSALIKQGESAKLEFKSTLRRNLYTDKNETRIENQCLKSVSAFLNSEGGTLLVGVNDDGEAIGMDADSFKDEDKLLLHWHNLMREYLGANMASAVRSNMHTLKDKRILVVQCTPSSVPVFLDRNNEEAFYVRLGNTSQALKPSEMLTFIDSRYGDAR
ncbi:response regulator [Agarivorans aestuarii]|jgi:CheY-like chemotaxis protein|uniref:Response regulator n=1 Tax=Agarivorans aestuarii TaxID=1563703 RepID=A0ABU7G6J6_9ALTE|nr:response regulator [Agarivorans aestuarii]MEE1675028.1 response regulator [Agarivorans aestuarii]